MREKRGFGTIDVLLSPPLKHRKCLPSTKWSHGIHLVLIEIWGTRFLGSLFWNSGCVPWPPRSPDHIGFAVIVFLWGYLKERVYAHKPRAITDLKRASAEEMESVQQNMLTRVADDFLQRIRTCIEVHNHNTFHVIFKK